MKSKTKINKQLKKKTNIEVINLVRNTLKNKEWLEVAELLASTKKNKIVFNLSEVNSGAQDKDIIVIPGKVLSMGTIDKKIKISALNYSEKAKQKLKDLKIDFNTLEEEIKNNSNAKGVKILRK